MAIREKIRKRENRLNEFGYGGGVEICLLAGRCQRRFYVFDTV